MKIDKCQNTASNLYNKKKNDLHIGTLKQVLDHVLISQKVHSVTE